MRAGSALAVAAALAASLPVQGQRPIAVDDVVALRRIDTLSVSPDARRFAILVRQADAATNDFRTGWFVGDARSGALKFVGHGGQLRPDVRSNGQVSGEVVGSESRWSPNSRWIAYTLRKRGEVQLWRSAVDGGKQEQVTRNVSDVLGFTWSEDGRALYFAVGLSRASLRAQREAKAREGYRYDADIYRFTDFMHEDPQAPSATNPSVWVVSLEDFRERLANEAERMAFERLSTSGVRDAEPVTALASDELRMCASAGERSICVRETPTQPPHMAAIDPKSGSIRVLSDVNPQFRGIRLGKSDRFEWDTPRFAWNEPGGALAGLYGGRAFGHILYPDGFDRRREYPVFIDPYNGTGFENGLGPEHALHVYAANGFVVLNLAFPDTSNEVMQGLGERLMSQMYSAELGFPHLTMYAESTLRGLDTAIARGFIDDRRVGIGGVSHGTFVPLYMLQKHDRIAAISISSPHWGPLQYYWSTRKARDMGVAYGGWPPKPEGQGAEYWSGMDIADHIDEIEAPILMQLADQETIALLRLIRHLADAQRPYDAYVFPREAHVKWQPAHLQAIMTRNLDWFRFWLQGHEDPAPNKTDQYVRWRKLRKMPQTGK